MSKILSLCLLALFIAGSLIGIRPAMAATGAADRASGNLVSVEWLEKNLKRGDTILIDASPGPMHTAKHIPGAVNVDVFSFGGRDNSSADMERLFQSWGVSKGKKIVISIRAVLSLRPACSLISIIMASRQKTFSSWTEGSPSGNRSVVR